MNEIANRFLLAGDKFMPELHLKQPGFAYSACGPFTKNKEKKTQKTQKFKETGDSWYIYQNELDKACFQHDFVYGDFKDLIRRIASDKILCDKEFSIAKNLKYDNNIKKNASEIYTTHNEGKSIFAERFIRTEIISLWTCFNGL